MVNRNKNMFKLKIILYLRIVFYPIIFLLDKFNILKFFSKQINFLFRLLGIKAHINEEFDYKIYSKIFKNSFSKNKDGNVILFPFSMGSASSFNNRTLLMCKHFQLKGFRPIIVICDGKLEICTHDRIGKNRKIIPMFCSSCYKHYDYIEKITGIEVIRFSDYYNSEKGDVIVKSQKKLLSKINSIDDLENFTYNNFPLGHLTREGVLRYFYRGNLINNKETIGVYKKYIISSLKTYLIANNIFDSVKGISKTILFNGVLNTDRVFSQISNDRGIDYVTQEVFIGSNSWIYKKNGIAIHLDWTEDWELIKHTKIDENSKTKVLKLFNGFKTGETVGIKFNDGSEKISSILDKKNRYAVLFTNLNFDTYTLGRDPVFESMYEWISETMEYWQRNVEGIQLIIRAHPAEIKLLTPSSDFTRNIVEPKLSDKFIFIDSDSKISSYEIFEYVDFGICYASTIGIELSLASIPNLIAGEAFFKKFTHYSKNKTEYFKILNNFINGNFNNLNNSEELIRFLHFIYFEKTTHFKGFDVDRQKGKISYSERNQEKIYELNRVVLEKFESYVFN